jgi:hypothetical protein
VALFQKVSVTGLLEDAPLLLLLGLLLGLVPPVVVLLLPLLEQAAAAKTTPRPSAAITAVGVFLIIPEAP